MTTTTLITERAAECPTWCVGHPAYEIAEHDEYGEILAHGTLSYIFPDWPYGIDEFRVNGSTCGGERTVYFYLELGRPDTPDQLREYDTNMTPDQAMDLAAAIRQAARLSSAPSGKMITTGRDCMPVTVQGLGKGRVVIAIGYKPVEIHPLQARLLARRLVEVAAQIAA